jgi:hypothetical protein
MLDASHYPVGEPSSLDHRGGKPLPQKPEPPAAPDGGINAESAFFIQQVVTGIIWLRFLSR